MSAKFLYNPDTGMIFNSTPELLKSMHKLKIIVCPEAVLREQRPELFEKVAEPAKVKGETPKKEVVTNEGDDFLTPDVGEQENKDVALTMDPNRLTLLMEAIGQLDPATDFTNAGAPIPAKMAKIVGSAVSASERDFAFAEYKNQ
jgi:hypothetical protein